MLPYQSRSLRVRVVGGGETVAERLSGATVEAGAPVTVDAESAPPPDADAGGAGDAVDCVVVDGETAAEPVDHVETARTARPDRPVVLLVAGADQGTMVDAVAAGVTETLPRRLATADPGLFAERVAALVAREREYERLFDAVNDAISVHDPRSGALVDVNETMCDLTGYDRGELLSMDVDDLGVADGAFTGDRLRRVVADGDPETVEWRVETAAGGRRVLESSLAPASVGGEERVLAISRDVTDRREYERRLRDERDRRSVLFENNPDPVLRVEFEDEVPVVREVNAAFESVFGYDAADVVGESVADAVVPDACREEHEAFRRQVVAGEPVEREAPRQTADGLRDFLFRVIHFDVDTGADDGTPSDAYVWYTDVSDRKRRERAARALPDATERMQDATTRAEVAEVAVEAVRGVLDLPRAACWFHDADAERLEPVAATDPGAEGEAGVGSPLPAGSDGYEAFREGTVTTYGPGDRSADVPFDSAVLLPLGDHGLVAAGRDGAGEYDAVTLDLARTVAEHATTALDRVERAREVRESERRFRTIAERIDQVIFLAAPDFSEAYYVNAAYEALWGQPVEELYDDARRFLDHVDERDREAFEAEFEAMLADIEAGDADDSYEFEYRIRRPDGEVRWVRATGYPVELVGGERRFVGIVEDVTERRELERTYRSVFENVSDGLVVHDPETGEIRDVNDRFCEMNGYDRDELVGRTIETITASDYTYADARERIVAAREEGPQLFEWRNRRADGETYPVEVHLSVVDVHGEERVLASVRDITERKRREREYEQIFDGVHDAITVHDPETGEILDVNDAMCELTGYEYDEVLERGIAGLSVAEEGYTEERGKEVIQRVMSSGEREVLEWKAETADGEHRWLEVNATPARINGEARYLAIQRDITERKRREREYEQMFNAVNDIINVYDPETKDLVRVNDTMCEVTGYDRETLLEEGLASVSATDEGFTGEEAAAIIDDVMASGEPRELEWRLETADGERVWLDVKATPASINGEDRLLTISRDVTDHRRRERQLQLIVDRIDEAIYLADEDITDPDYLSPAYEEVTGIPPGQWDDEAFLEYVHPEDLEAFQEDLWAMMEEIVAGEAADSYDFEFRFRRPDGETRWLEWSGYPLADDEEYSYVGVLTDITERKRRERAVRRNERRLEVILDRIDEAVFLAPVSELDAAQPAPDFVSSGYEAIWGRSLADLQEEYEEGFFGTLHPDEYEEYRALVDRIIDDVAAGEAADRYSHEYRIERPDGERRWVRSDFYPTEWGDGTPRIVIASRDVTDRKDRERALESFHDATAELTTVDTVDEAGRLAVGAAADVFDLPATAVYHYDDETGRLEPTATGPGVPEDATLPALTADDEAVWGAFVEERMERLAVADEPALDVGASDEALLFPLSRNGVLAVWPDADGFDTDAASILAATLEAALNRLRGERRLESRRAELEAQAERARRLESVTELTQRVEAAITTESSRAGIQEAVCSELTDVDPFDAAWVAEAEVGTDRLTPRTVAGVAREAAERALPDDAAEDGDPHPAVESWRTGEPAVVTDLVGGGRRSDWRQALLRRGTGAVCAVPLVYNDVTHGVLTIHAATPDAFGEQVVEVLDQLGTSIGYAITAVERQRALESDDTLELEFAGEGVDLPFARLARAVDARVRHERTVSRQDGTVSVYYTLTGDLPEDVVEVASSTLPGTTTLVSRGDGEAVVESRGSSWFGSLVSEYGGVLRRGVAAEGRVTLVVELPQEAETRTIVERLVDAVPGVELTAQRQHRETESTPGELRDRLERRLSDRQYEALETAHAMGYFHWPRESSGEDVADTLGITQPTVNKHIRLGERKLFDLLFDGDATEA